MEINDEKEITQFRKRESKFLPYRLQTQELDKILNLEGKSTKISKDKIPKCNITTKLIISTSFFHVILFSFFSFYF